MRNESNKTEVRYLLHLLACAFGNKTPAPPDGVDFGALLNLAQKHQVYSIIFPLLAPMESVPAEEKARFRDYSLSELKRMLVVNSEREAIFASLTAEGIRFMPLKGLILKAYYPKESMRQMSDNDLLFDAKNRDKVAAIMKAQGYKATATGENSDDYHKPPYSTFEFHRTLFFEEHAFCPRFDNLWEKATPDAKNPCLYHMAKDDVYIYNVCHMYKHYSTAGCGIRFLADNYLFLKAEAQNLDRAYIEEKLTEYGILGFETETRALAFKIFEEQALTEEEEQLLDIFIHFGIFGSESQRLTKTMEGYDGTLKEAKRRYLLTRLFPPKKKMLADYRVLERKPWLLPAYYIFRLFKGIAHPKETFGEVKNVKNIKE